MAAIMLSPFSLARFWKSNICIILRRSVPQPPVFKCAIQSGHSAIFNFCLCAHDLAIKWLEYLQYLIALVALDASIKFAIYFHLLKFNYETRYAQIQVQDKLNGSGGKSMQKCSYSLKWDGKKVRKMLRLWISSVFSLLNTFMLKNNLSQSI